MDNKFFIFVEENWAKIKELLEQFANFIKKILDDIKGEDAEDADE